MSSAQPQGEDDRGIVHAAPIPFLSLEPVYSAACGLEILVFSAAGVTGLVLSDQDLASNTPLFDQLLVRFSLVTAVGSHLDNDGSAIPGDRRTYAMSFPSSSNEDRISRSVFQFGSMDHRYMMYGIYDGHNGSAASAFLAFMLPGYLATCLNAAFMRCMDDTTMDLANNSILVDQSSALNRGPSDDEVDRAITHAFLELDRAMVHVSVRNALGLDETEYKRLTPVLDPFPDCGPLPLIVNKSGSSRFDANMGLPLAYSGSCAIVGIFTNRDRTLRIASTGDSRAVLGRRVAVGQQDGKGKGSSTSPSKHLYEVHKLTEDQNASNPSEAKRLTALHPNEPDLLKNGRVLGWGPARSFGDASMKLSVEVQERLHEKFLGDRPRKDLIKTPPYFTAEPVITKFSNVRKGDFVIMGSDGLWECLEPEEAVGLVGRWLEENGVKGRDQARNEVMIPSYADKNSEPGNETSTTYLPSELPVIFPKDYKDDTVRYKYWRSEKRFISTSKDEDNVARHLMRNALGGADTVLSEILCRMTGTRARRFRDDISIQIIFFE